MITPKQPQEQLKIEHDIERLASELEKKRQILHVLEGKDKEREILHGAIGETIKSAEPATEAHGIHVAQTAQDDDTGDLPAYANIADPQVRRRVHHLVQLAIHEGIAKAARHAKNQDAFVIDAFHDALVDRVYNELKARGKLR